MENLTSWITGFSTGSKPMNLGRNLKI